MAFRKRCHDDIQEALDIFLGNVLEVQKTSKLKGLLVACTFVCFPQN